MKITKFKPIYSVVAILFLFGSLLFVICGGEGRSNAGNADNSSPSIAIVPRLYFSDLESAPKSGWEGSSTKGAAVTVWGKNFGLTRGSSFVTVNGTRLTDETDYGEWGTTGTTHGIPRGLERTTFWLNNNCQEGVGTISITVNGITSNTLPFRVRGGNIYFISVSAGDDSNNGKYASKQRGRNGSWKTMKMALHHNNSVIKPGDIIYVRAGTYTQEDEDGALMRARCDYGTLAEPIAIVGYPGEMPLMDMTNIRGAKRGVFSVEGGTYNGRYGLCNLDHGADYFIFSKMKVIHGTVAFGIWGVGNRIVGNHFQDNNDEAWSGVVMVDTSQNVHIYGNYFDHNGYDPYKHDIYVKTHDSSEIGTMKTARDIYIGWNEFNRWTADLNPHARPSRGGAIDVDTESSAIIKGKLTNHVYIFNNYFHDGDSQALYLCTGTKYNIVFNNVFAKITCNHGGILLWDLDNTSLFYNNTFYFAAPQSAGIIVLLNGSGNSVPKSPSPYWKNNIYYGYKGQSYARVEFPYSFNSDHDLFFGNGSPTGSHYSVTNPVVGDPHFVSGGVDFHLRSTSPAVNTGSSAVSSIVVQDYEGVPRPQGPGYDIGAFEYYR